METFGNIGRRRFRIMYQNYIVMDEVKFNAKEVMAANHR